MSDALQKTVAEFLRDKTLVSGLGTDESPCSIAAINLALTGKLTDSVPECMSLVIGKTILVLQDAMPDAMRNSDAWRTLLPLAAGSGRQHEAQRLAVLLDWMWSVALPEVQPVAEANGFGGEWAHMCSQKSAGSAKVAAWAASEAAEQVTSEKARAARAADQNFWDRVDVPELLRRMIEAPEDKECVRHSFNCRKLLQRWGGYRPACSLRTSNCAMRTSACVNW